MKTFLDKLKESLLSWIAGGLIVAILGYAGSRVATYIEDGPVLRESIRVMSESMRRVESKLDTVDQKTDEASKQLFNLQYRLLCLEGKK